MEQGTVSYQLSSARVRGTSARANLFAFFAASLCLSVSPQAFSAEQLGLPSGGAVSHGAATLDYATPDQLHIHQQSQKTVIDWQSFDIGAGKLTAFHQPNADAIAVNRVIGAGMDPTQILGSLRANGNVVVLDNNGVIFGADSRIDVGGIIVSTGDIDKAEFMNDAHLSLYDIGSDAEIVNYGHISVRDAGLAAFVAPAIHNSGVVTAKIGHAVLASGSSATLDFYGDGLIELALDQGRSQEIINTGKISADGGYIRMETAVARDVVDNLIVNTGVVVANSVAEDASGKIRLYAAGAHQTEAAGQSTVIHTGTMDASGRGAGQHGGEIEILGDHIGIMDGAVIDASGTHGGGDIKIGGDYLGSGDTPTSLLTYVASGASIFNDAIEIGNGGRTIIWSDDHTSFYGNVYARGGMNGGNGGFVETSGKRTLVAEGYVDLTAAQGDKGTYLLDPENIIIYGGVDDEFNAGDGSADLSADKVLKINPIANIDEAGYILGTNTSLNNFSAFSAVDNADVNVATSVFFAANITIPENPSGVIYEQGGSGFGTYVGFQSDGTLVFHAGRGSSFSAADAAHIEIAPTDVNRPMGTGTLSWKIDIASNRIVAYWNGVQIAEDTAAQSFSSWSGGDAGGYGQRTSSLVIGANVASFNGDLNEDLKYYEYTQDFLSDLSGRGNNPIVTAGSPDVVDNAINGLSVVRFADSDRVGIADTNDINLLSQSEITRSFTFSTDGDVTQEQLLYKEGGGTNGYVAYIENGKLNVGLYNSGGSPRAYHQYDVLADTDYHLTTTFDAAENSLVTRLNGDVISGAALGADAPFLAHSGDIVFGRNDTTIINENGGSFNPIRAVPDLAEAVFYNTALNDVEQQLMEQYASAKFGIALKGTGTGENEVERATAADGYSVFAADYLERLSDTADIVLQANNAIKLDLRGDTLTLADDRNLTLQTSNGDITDVSAGRITANRMSSGGNISFIAGGAGNIDIDQLALDTRGGGVVNMSAQGDINLLSTETLNLGQFSAQNIYVETQGASDVVLHNTLSAQAAGNSLVLNTGRNFVNNHDAAALDAGAGRWLVYSADPAANTLGGVTADFKRYNKTYAGYAPAAVAEDGAGLFYSIAPVVTVTAKDVAREYGDTNPNFTSTYTGLIDGDVASYALGGAADYAALGADGDIGMSAITPSIGTLSSDLGYQFAFADGVLTIDPATLAIKVNDAARDEGQTNPEFDATITGFKLSDSRASLDVAPLFQVDATPLSPAGIYDISAYGASDRHYNFVYIDGALQVNPVVSAVDLPATVRSSLQGAALRQLPRPAAVVGNLGNAVLLPSASPRLVATPGAGEDADDTENKNENRISYNNARIEPAAGAACLVSHAGDLSCVIH